MRQQNGSVGVTKDRMMVWLNPVPNYDEDLHSFILNELVELFLYTVLIELGQGHEHL